MNNQLKGVGERFPSSAQQTADPTKNTDSCKMGDAQCTHQQEKPLKMASEDEVPLVSMSPSCNMIYLCQHLYG
jgi:hypothetical protein